MTIRNGFTLVELAISLMVIGLLIGGVLKGQELIENARLTRAVKNISDYNAAVMIFYSSYDALPGDMAQTNRLPNCTEDPCQIPGNDNDRIGDLNVNIISGTYPERVTVWVHLQYAGLINNANLQGTHRNDVSPRSPWGGPTWLRERNNFHNNDRFHYYTFGDQDVSTPNGIALLSLNRTKQIDIKLDDGKPSTGRVQIFLDSNSSTGCYDTTTLEYTQTGNITCFSGIRLNIID